ncbi:hypothetical protein [Paenibacillus sp. BJ-4]|uniref:hypothetical protein n=1 Tax=Paenibacillus sp. BJ-4 TaxID=2878097 RepID=UPI0029901943|nr:hypothetical protein [Paenibacillus sp. BJ-4]
MTQRRILVPIRFVSENFGYKANYEKLRAAISLPVMVWLIMHPVLAKNQVIITSNG